MVGAARGLPADLLSLEAGEAARRIALAMVEETEEGLRRLAAGDDAEALHDVRVAVRRLRSHLRAYRRLVGEDLPARTSGRLRRAARGTNSGRDAEVVADLLRQARTASRSSTPDGVGVGAEDFALGGPARRAAARLESMSRERAARVYATDVGRARAQLERLLPRVRRGLAKYRLPIDLDAEGGGERRVFGPVAAGAVRERASALREALRRFERTLAMPGVGADEVPDGDLGDASEDDPVASAHRARVAGKKLRYLLEPLRGGLPQARAVVADARRLQDILGRINDLAMLARTIERAMIGAAAEKALGVARAARSAGLDSAAMRSARATRPGAGLAALLAGVAAVQARAFDGLRLEWLGGRGDAFFASIEGLADELDAAGAQPARLGDRSDASGAAPAARGRGGL